MTHRVPWVAAAFACAVALAPGAGRAATEAEFEVHSTGDLVSLCDPKANTTMDVAAVNFCQGYVVGVISLQMIDDAALRRGEKLFCLPNPAPSRNEGIAAFVAWARATPSRLADPPIDSLFRYAHERFPCSK